MKKNKEEKVMSGFQIEKRLYEEFQVLVAKRDTTVSQFLRSAIRDFVDRCNAKEAK